MISDYNNLIAKTQTLFFVSIIKKKKLQEFESFYWLTMAEKLICMLIKNNKKKKNFFTFGAFNLRHLLCVNRQMTQKRREKKRDENREQILRKEIER